MRANFVPTFSGDKFPFAPNYGHIIYCIIETALPGIVLLAEGLPVPHEAGLLLLQQCVALTALNRKQMLHQFHSLYLPFKNLHVIEGYGIVQHAAFTLKS